MQNSWYTDAKLAWYNVSFFFNLGGSNELPKISPRSLIQVVSLIWLYKFQKYHFQASVFRRIILINNNNKYIYVDQLPKLQIFFPRDRMMHTPRKGSE